MKKYLSLILAVIMLLSLAACSGNGGQTANATQEPTEAPTAEPTEEPMLKIGDTYSGEIVDITINSVSYIDKIENGIYRSFGPYNSKNKSLSILAEEGYSFVKIDFSYNYHGKTTGTYWFLFYLDYDDGYTFGSLKDHSKNTPSSGVGFSEYYTINKSHTSITVDDPLTDNHGTATAYLVINNSAINTDKPLVIKTLVPKVLSTNSSGPDQNSISYEQFMNNANNTDKFEMVEFSIG